MDESAFCKVVNELSVGKELPEAVYIHRQALEEVAPTSFVTLIDNIGKAVGAEPASWNLVKLWKNQFRLSLLSYPSFESEAYPALERSISINLAERKHRVIEYQSDNNPPILHRKETLVTPAHPLFDEFKEITEEGVQAGLYENSSSIGFKESWERLIQRHGYELIDGRLFRSSMVAPTTDGIQVDRHKTALVRYELSLPMKTLAKHGYLNGDFLLFDYGCGRGDDLNELEAHGVNASGWDPNFRPDADIIPAQVVNLGYVLNVIEDIDERIDALQKAWALADTLLVVSCMLAGESHISRFKPYKDGVLTSRNTFQKYYSQSELSFFIERTLDEAPIPVGSGIFYLFKDKVEEQRFLASRCKRKYKWRQLSTPRQTPEEKLQELIFKHKELIDEFWQTCLELGRLPAADEFKRYEELTETIGSPKKAIRLIGQLYDLEELEVAKEQRTEDYLLFFALELFRKRKPYNEMPADQQRDLKAFFDNYSNARSEAAEVLYSIANCSLIEEACIIGHQQLPASILNDGHSLILHSKFVEQLPLILRVYVGAALQLFGDCEEIDLVKIHITSGKVSFMLYEDFENQPTPFLKERVKVRMAEQEVDYFDYLNKAKRPPLLHKSHLIDDSFADFKKQKSFDKRAIGLKLFSEELDENITRIEYQQRLAKAQKVINGYRFFSAP